MEVWRVFCWTKMLISNCFEMKDSNIWNLNSWQHCISLYYLISVTEKLRHIPQMNQRHERKMHQTPQSSHKLGLGQWCPYGNYHPWLFEASRIAVYGPNVQGNSGSVTQRQLISSHHKNVATNASHVPARPPTSTSNAQELPQTGLNVQKKSRFVDTGAVHSPHEVHFMFSTVQVCERTHIHWSNYWSGSCRVCRTCSYVHAI